MLSRMRRRLKSIPEQKTLPNFSRPVLRRKSRARESDGAALNRPAQNSTRESHAGEKCGLVSDGHDNRFQSL
jgi:hypothetical protein